MKKIILVYSLLVVQAFTYSQVGINTTQPSPASVLDVKSSKNGIDFGGFMPPRVSSLSERATINPTITDIGLLIFLSDAVNNNFCLQIWNGTTWEDISCITTPAIVDIATQDFDSNLTWTYTVNPIFYSSGNDTWNIVNTLPNIISLTDNFLGCRDLDNTNGGGNFLHEILLNNVNVSAFTNVQVVFNYDVFEFDGGDDVFYELFLDDVGQGVVQLINGMNGGGVTDNGTIVLNVPGGTTNVRLTLGVIQNGDDDMAGFDNFRIVGL